MATWVLVLIVAVVLGAIGFATAAWWVVAVAVAVLVVGLVASGPPRRRRD